MFFRECVQLASEHPELRELISRFDSYLHRINAVAVIQSSLYSKLLSASPAQMDSVLELLTDKNLLSSETVLECGRCRNFRALHKHSAAPIDEECSSCGERSHHDDLITVVYRYNPATRPEHQRLGLLITGADLHTDRQEFIAARKNLDEALALATHCGSRLHEADAHLAYTRLHLAEKNQSAAREHLVDARQIINEIGYHRRDQEIEHLASQTVVASSHSPAVIPEQGFSLMTTPPNEMFDVAIICALHKLELDNVLKKGQWESRSFADDPNSYQVTTYTTAKGNILRVVAAAPTQMGMPASAVLATKMILRFRPKLVAMVGIAAGAKSDKQGYGDILAPNQTFDYGAGKYILTDGKIKFEPGYEPIRISEALRDRLSHWSSRRTHLDDISNHWPIASQQTRLAIHVGPLGSGAAVIDVKQPVQDILEHWRKLIGIEMEAYAVHLACENAARPKPEFLCMKSICDFATDKIDLWRDYAAYTSAELFYRFLTEEWENFHLDPR